MGANVNSSDLIFLLSAVSETYFSPRFFPRLLDNGTLNALYILLLDNPR